MADPLVAVTGTPGTGKTTASDRLDVPVVHLNEAIREADLATGVDDERGSLIADLDAVETYVRERAVETDGPLVVESHLAHEIPADRVVVLRCEPSTIEERLRDRGESTESARENAESEALDLVLAEAVDRHGEGAVYEVDATDLDPDAVAAAIESVGRDERTPAAGTVDWTLPFSSSPRNDR